MKLTQFLTLISFAATTLAGPTLILRTGEVSCGQNNGIAACCDQKQVKKPFNQVKGEVNKDQQLAGLLGNLLNVLLAPLIAPDVGVALQCQAIGVIVPNINSCKANNVCCFNPKTATTETNSGGLINLLNSNNIALCPNINVL